MDFKSTENRLCMQDSVLPETIRCDYIHLQPHRDILLGILSVIPCAFCCGIHSYQFNQHLQQINFIYNK